MVTEHNRAEQRRAEARKMIQPNGRETVVRNHRLVNMEKGRNRVESAILDYGESRKIHISTSGKITGRPQHRKSNIVHETGNGRRVNDFFHLQAIITRRRTRLRKMDLQDCLQ